MQFWHIKTKSNKQTDEGSTLQHTQTPEEIVYQEGKHIIIIEIIAFLNWHRG
jgi:hypothetical protein